MRRTKEVSQIVGVSDHTVRLWSDRYADYLSPGASPEKGAIREFTDDDIRVFLTVKRESDRRIPLEDIREVLDGGALVEDIPPIEREPDQPVPAEQHTLALARIDALSRELQQTREAHQRELARLQTLYDAEKEERQAAQARIEDLQREMGKLEGRLEELDKRKGLFR